MCTPSPERMAPGRGTVAVWVMPALSPRALIATTAAPGPGAAVKIESGGWLCIEPAARSNPLPTARVRPQTLSIQSFFNRGGFGCLLAYKEPSE